MARVGLGEQRNEASRTADALERPEYSAGIRARIPGIYIRPAITRPVIAGKFPSAGLLPRARHLERPAR